MADPLNFMALNSLGINEFARIRGNEFTMLK